MNLHYKSTRNSDLRVTASEAILTGLAPDGGLFVPEQIPKLDVSMEALSKMTYQETAYTVMKQFLTDFSEEELKDCIRKAYDSKFDTEEIAPIVKAGDAYYLELFHGATIAFKDMALSITIATVLFAVHISTSRDKPAIPISPPFCPLMLFLIKFRIN